jgi:DNA-binding transcriptional MerR regulator
MSEFRVRWYERVGLVHGVARTSGRQRRYTEEQVVRLEQIASWRRQGLSVRDMKALVGQGEPPAARLLDMVTELHRRVEGLRTLAQATTAGTSALVAGAPGSPPASAERNAAASRAKVPPGRAQSR